MSVPQTCRIGRLQVTDLAGAGSGPSVFHRQMFLARLPFDCCTCGKSDGMSNLRCRLRFGAILQIVIDLSCK